MSAFTHVSESDFDGEVLKSDKPVLVDLWADWCGPCHAIAPVLDDIAAADADERFKFVKVDVDQNPGISAKFNVRSIPTLLVVKDGQEYGRMVGSGHSRAALQKWLESALNPA